MAISRGETEAGSGTTYKTQAEKWAENPENTPVVPGKYSALHHAAKAKDSETAAKASEDAARASEQAAATSESNAKDSEDAAALSESNAATSESNAAASESAAATSEWYAADAASAAAANESSAAVSASAAATSASNAADSEAAALASLEDFLDHYYGSYSSEPTTDPNGNPVNAGDMYWDTTIGELRVYDGSTWISTAYNSSNVNITGGNISGIAVGDIVNQLPEDFYEETVLPLDGDFDDGELRIVRMGNVVTVSMSAISPPLPLAPSAHTTTDFLPSHLRPIEDVTNIFYMDAYGFIMAAIRSWGGFSIRAADYSGGNSNIEGAYGFSISYITNYGWPSG